MLVELAVRSDGFLRRRFGLLGLILEILDALVDLLQLVRAAVERLQALRDVIQLPGHGGRVFGDLLQLFAERSQLRPACREGAEHRAERAALFAGIGNQNLKRVGLLLGFLAFSVACDVPERVEHGDSPWREKTSLSLSAQLIKICNAWQTISS